MREFFIFFAIVGLHAIGISANKYELAFTWWLCINRPDMLTQDGRDKLAEFLPVDALDEIRSWQKGAFLDMFLQP